MFPLSWKDSTSSSIISLQLSSDPLEVLVVSLLSCRSIHFVSQKSLFQSVKSVGVQSPG